MILDSQRSLNLTIFPMLSVKLITKVYYQGILCDIYISSLCFQKAILFLTWFLNSYTSNMWHIICLIRLTKESLYWKPTDRIYLNIELEIKNLIASYIMSKISKISNWILCGKQTHLHKHNLERFNSILMHWNKPPFQTQVHLSSVD